MNDEAQNLNQLNSSSDPHSPIDQVRCLLCQTIPDQYISLDCKDDFCLTCLAQKYHEMKECHEVLINDCNNYEIYCPACKAPTLLDEASINALEETLTLMKSETQKNDLFNEIIMEDSAENNNIEEGIKIEEKKSFEVKYFQEERKDKDMNSNQNLEQNRFQKEKNPQKLKNVFMENEKRQDFETKPLKKFFNEPNFSNSSSIPDKKDKGKLFLDFDSNDNSSEKFKSSEPKCLKHRNEITNLYCFTCENSCICVECLVEGVHRNHNVKNVSKGSEILIDRINKFNEKINRKTFESKDVFNKLENEKKAAISFMNENIESIRVKFKEINLKIKHKEQEILKGYEKINREKIDHIDSLIQEYHKNKESLNEIKAPISFDKLSLSSQINYYNNYSENLQKVSKLSSHHKNNPFFFDQKTLDLKIPAPDFKGLNNLFKVIDVLPNELPSSSKMQETKEILDLNNFNRKLRMEPEYMQETPMTLETNTNQPIISQSSSFLAAISDMKLPLTRFPYRFPYKKLMIGSEKNSLILKKDLKSSTSDIFRLSSKGWSKTPTHSTEAYLELQQRKFEKQKEFFFQNFK